MTGAECRPGGSGECGVAVLSTVAPFTVAPTTRNAREHDGLIAKLDKSLTTVDHDIVVMIPGPPGAVFVLAAVNFGVPGLARRRLLGGVVM
jgi:hypothetical protein